MAEVFLERRSDLGWQSIYDVARNDQSAVQRPAGMADVVLACATLDVVNGCFAVQALQFGVNCLHCHGKCGKSISLHVRVKLWTIYTHADVIRSVAFLCSRRERN